MADPNKDDPRDVAKSGRGKDSVVSEAQKRWKAQGDWEGDARKLFVADQKFANADSDNQWQWPAEILNDRIDAGKGISHPTLTINKVRQHNFQISNDAKKNKPAIKYSPAGGEATFESAQIWSGLARHIEQISNAPAHYDSATKSMVDCGWGYVRVRADYMDETSFNQEIYILPVQNPLNVSLDMHAIQPDQIDAKFGFIIEDLDKDVFKLKYPRFASAASQQPFDGEDMGWYNDTTIRVAEYYRLHPKTDILWMYVPAGAQEPVLIKDSLLSKELRDNIKEKGGKSRPITEYQLEWYLIVGNEKVDEAKLPGKYIPIAKFAGETTVVDGKFDCKSHTRFLKDPQRMYNYWSSAAVEFGALQTKTPWMGSAEALEGYEKLWNNANTENTSVLLYNAIGDDGTTRLEAPQRVQPPVAAPVALEGMRIANDEMMSVSGQYQAMLGMQGNERSAKAIQERQRQGDTATYHYINASALAIRKVGKIIKDIIPAYYDSRRIVQIIGEDGKAVDVMIDPQAKKGYEERQLEAANGIQRVLNPALGDYDIVVDVGPSYATRREEAFNAFAQLLQQAPELVNVLGDIFFRMGDFPMSEEAADRLKRLVPPAALGEGPTQAEQQLQLQLQNMQTLLKKLMEEGAKRTLELKDKSQQRVTDAYNAMTMRFKALLDAKSVSLDAKEVDSVIFKTLHEIFSTPMEEANAASEPRLEQAAGAQGAAPSALGTPPLAPGQRQGFDGIYMRDYAQNSSYRRVE